MTSDPSTPPADRFEKTTTPGDTTPTATTPTVDTTPRTVEKTRAASTYAFLVVGALVTVALLVFIIQNLDDVDMTFFGLGWTLPVGINMLIAALAGAIITGLVGAVRISQLRRAYKKA